jgi:hypothetical protein
VREAEADAVLAETRSGLEGRRQAVAEAEATHTAAESQATLARATLGRYRHMFEERALSQQEFDEVVARAGTAEAEAARASAPRRRPGGGRAARKPRRRDRAPSRSRASGPSTVATSGVRGAGRPTCFQAIDGRLDHRFGSNVVWSRRHARDRMTEAIAWNLTPVRQ